MKIKPLANPEDAGPADILGVMYQLHECVEQHRADDRADHNRVVKRIGRLEKSVNHDLAELAEKVGKIGAGQHALQKAVGVDDKGKRIGAKPVLAMGFWEFTGKIGGGLTGVFVMLQIGVAVWPGVWSALRALWALAINSPH